MQSVTFSTSSKSSWTVRPGLCSYATQFKNMNNIISANNIVSANIDVNTNIDISTNIGTNNIVSANNTTNIQQSYISIIKGGKSYASIIKKEIKSNYITQD